MVAFWCVESVGGCVEVCRDLRAHPDQEEDPMRPVTRLTAATAAALMAAAGAVAPALAAPAEGATVVRGQAFYVDGGQYRTVLTPRDLPSRAPAHSFDVLYNFQRAQPAVAEAAPGLPGYNGGRWIVNLVDYADGWQMYADGTDAEGHPVFVSDEAVEAAIAADALIVTYDVRRFVCPVIKL